MIYKEIGSKNPDIVLTVLENRNLTTDEVNEILNPTIEEYNPTLMKNMDKGIKSLEDAIGNKLKIGILQDPDCDGLLSASMIHNYITEELNYKNVEVIFHVKFTKSHGLDTEIVDYIKEKEIGFMILPDAGSTLQDYNNIKLMPNIQFLILDHHNVEWPYDLDNAILINPHQKYCNYPNKFLSGAAVTYKFIEAFSQDVNNLENKYVDIAACSLISDMMNMLSLENRLLLYRGTLKDNITSPLIQSFIVAKGLQGDYLSIENIAFSISSNINGLIRVGSQEDKELLFRSVYGTELVKSNKRGSYGAMEMIQDEVIRRMTNSKSKQDKSVKLAVEKIKESIENNNMLDDKVLMLDVNNIMDNSITGLVANKVLNEISHRPTLFYRHKKKDSNIVGGSARAIGVDDFKGICQSSNLFEYVSGHTGAFGFEIKEDKLSSLKEYFNNKLSDVEFEKEVMVDAIYNIEVPSEDIEDIANLNDLWCNQIQEPKFVIKNVILDTSKILKIGNATYSFKVGNMSFTKNFGSKVFIETFAKEEMIDKKAKFPFSSKKIKCDILCKFRKNTQGYYYIEIVDAETKEI